MSICTNLPPLRCKKIEITLTVKQSWPYDEAEKWVAISYFICHPAREMYKANLGCFFKFSYDTWMFCFYNQMSPATLLHMKTPIWKQTMGSIWRSRIALAVTSLRHMAPCQQSFHQVNTVTGVPMCSSVFQTFQISPPPNLANVRKYGLICSWSFISL